jgi:tetratricopeptide (TPR) repeat protein
VEGNESAEILAHICWAQAIRVKNHMPAVIDVDAVFEEALGASPQNVYANAMLGHWILMRRGVTVKDIASAQSKFAIAVKNRDKRAFARTLQFSSLVSHSYGRDDEVERAALGALLRESFSMMKNNEPKPAENFRRKILNAYGTMGRAEHIEASVGMMPPADHLAVHAWLMDGLDYPRPRALAQAKYLRARLMEELGKKAEALEFYQSLLKEPNTAKQLDDWVNKAIGRLSGRLPERALARSYLNDSIDENDPWRFHMDTLSHFDPRWKPANFDQALEYFEKAISRPDQKLPDQKFPELKLPDPKFSELIRSLPSKLDRIRQVVWEGDKIEMLNVYTSDFSIGHHENARLNLLNLGHIYVRALTAGGKPDKAIAELGDMKKVVDRLNDAWTEMRAWIAFEFARAHAIRAGLNKSDADAANALKYLKTAVDSAGFNHEIATWDEIKGDVFKSIRNDPAYRELIRGR